VPTVRFYFPLDTAGAVSPTPDAGWDEKSDPVVTRALVRATPGSSTLTTVDLNNCPGGDHIADYDSLHRIYVSAPLAAQTILSTTTIKGQFQALESNAGNNLSLAVKVYIANGTTGALESSLLALTRLGSEAYTSIRNLTLPATALNGSGGNVTVTDGQRLVLEIGVGGLPVATTGTQNHRASLRWGETAASGDLPINESEVGTGYRPWVEFSNDITLSTITPIAPAAISDPWENLADAAPTVYSFAPLTYALSADPWENLADQPVDGGRRRVGWIDSTTYDKQNVSATTPITIPGLTDPWESLGDSTPTVIKFGFLTAAPAADPWGNIADSAPTLSKFGYLTVAPSADPWGNLADSTPTVSKFGYLTAALSADANAAYVDSISISIALSLTDAWSNLADQAPTVDRQIVGSNAINIPNLTDDLGQYADQTPVVFEFGYRAVAPTADPWQNLADQTPTVSEFGYRFVAPAADPWGNLADLAPSVSEFGYIRIAPSADDFNLWADTPTVSKQDVASTPITKTLSDDANTWDDIAPSKERRRAGWQDAIVYDEQSTAGVLARSFTDAWANIADQSALLYMALLVGRVVYLVDENGNQIVDENGNAIVTAGLIDNLAFSDSVTKDLQSIGTTPITRTFSDDLGQYADQAPTIREIGNLSAAPAADSWGTLADSGPTVSRFGYLTVAPAADPWGNAADSAPTVFQFGYLRVTPSTDANTAYVERFGLGIGTVDDLNLWGDSRTVSTSGQVPYQYSLADSLDNWAEQLSLGMSLRGDANAAYTDSADRIYGKLYRPANDAWGNLADSAPTVQKNVNKTAAPAADANAAYTDKPTVGRGFVDQWPEYGERLSIGLGMVDANAAYTDQVLQGGVGSLLFPNLSDDLQNWADSGSGISGLICSPPTDTMVMADQPGIGFGFRDDFQNWQDSSAAQLGYLADLLEAADIPVDRLDLMLLGYNEVIGILADTWENLDDAATWLKDVYGIRLNGRLIDRVNLAGMVKESVTLSGRVKEDVTVEGRNYSGDL